MNQFFSWANMNNKILKKIKSITATKVICGSLFLLFIIAILTRIYLFGEIPTGLYWDEIAMYVDVKSLLATGQDMHGRPWYQLIFPSYGDYKLPIFIWLATVSSFIFGLSEFSFRFPSFIAGLSTILASFLLSKEIFRDTKHTNIIALSSAFVVALSPWAFTFSRTGFEGHMGQMLLAYSILFLFYSRKNKWFLLLSVLYGVFATYSYFSVRFVWPVVFISSALYIFNENTNYKGLKVKTILAQFLKTIIALIMYFSLLIPFYKADFYSEMSAFRYGTDSILINDTRIHTVNYYRLLSGDSFLDRAIFHRNVLLLKELGKNYSDHLSLHYLFFTGDENLRHGTGYFGLFLPIFILFFFVGLYYLITKNNKVFAILIIWWLAALLPASVPETTPHALRSLNALIPLSIIIGYGLSELIVYYRLSRPSLHKNIVAGIVTLVIAIEFFFFIYHYFTVYPNISATSWQTGYKQWAQTIYSHRKNNEKIIVIPTDEKFYLWLMAYGNYTGEEFKTWQSHSFHFRSFDNVDIGTNDTIVSETASEFLIAIPKKNLAEIVQRKNYTIDILNEFPILESSDTFIIAKVRQ